MTLEELLKKLDGLERAATPAPVCNGMLMNDQDWDLCIESRNNLRALLNLIKKQREALEFYADENKYFMRKKNVNLKETTAVFHTDDPNNLDENYEMNIFDCSNKIKIDQGKKAKEALSLTLEDLK